MPRFTTADLIAMGYDQDGKQICIKTPLAVGNDRERDLHDAILLYCRRNGLPVVHSRMDRPTTSGIGSPDFIIALKNGVTLWVECKTAKGKLTAEQQSWMHWLKGFGHLAEVVRSIGQFHDLMNGVKLSEDK